VFERFGMMSPPILMFVANVDVPVPLPTTIGLVNVCVLPHVFAVVVPNARERTFEAICRGYVALVILFVYAVPHSVVEAVSGMVYPEVREKTPVPLVYVIPAMEFEIALRASVSL